MIEGAGGVRKSDRRSRESKKGSDRRSMDSMRVMEGAGRVRKMVIEGAGRVKKSGRKSRESKKGE